MTLPEYAKAIGIDAYKNLQVCWDLGCEETETVDEAAAFWMMAIEETDQRKTEFAFDNDGRSINCLASFLQYNTTLCFQGMEKAACEYYDPEQHGVYGLAVFGRAFSCNSFNKSGTIKMHSALLSKMDYIPKEALEAVYNEGANNRISNSLGHFLIGTAHCLYRAGTEHPQYQEVKEKLFKQLDRLFSPSLQENVLATACLSTIYNHFATDLELSAKKADFLRLFSEIDDGLREGMLEYRPRIKKLFENTPS